MEWTKSESSEYHELTDKGVLVASVDEVEVRGATGWAVWDRRGQQVATAPTLQAAMQAARTLCTSTA